MWSSQSPSLTGGLIDQCPNGVHFAGRMLSGRRGKGSEHGRSAARGKAGVRGDGPLRPIPGGERGQPDASSSSSHCTRAKPAARAHPTGHDRSRGRNSRSGGGGGACVLGAVRGEPEHSPAVAQHVQLSNAGHHRPDVSYDAALERFAWNAMGEDPQHSSFDLTVHAAFQPARPAMRDCLAQPPPPPHQPAIVARSHSYASDGPFSHSAPLGACVSDYAAPFDVCARPTRSHMEPRATVDRFVSDREWPFAAHDALDSTATLSEDSLSPHAPWSHNTTHRVRSTTRTNPKVGAAGTWV